MKSQNKMLAFAAVLALALTAFALVPLAQDSDADAFAIDSVTVSEDGMTLSMVFNTTLAKGTAYTVYLDDEVITTQSVTFDAGISKIRVALTEALDDEEHVLTVDAGSVGTATYTINGETPVPPVVTECTVGFDIELLTVYYDGGKFLNDGDSVDAGTVITLKATLPTGQELTSITAVYEDGTTEEVSEGTYTVTKDVEFVVAYEPEEYTLTIVEETAKVCDEDGEELETGATVTFGQTLTVEAAEFEGKYVYDSKISGLEENDDGTYTVDGEVSVEFLYKEIEYFDLTFTKTDGVVYKLDGEEVSGTVKKVEIDTVLTVVPADGYEYTDSFAVKIDGKEIEYDVGYHVQQGGIVTVSGIEEIDYKNATLSGDVVGETVFADYQIVTVSGTCTLTEGAKVLVNGKLVIPEGATLTVKAGAVLVAMQAEIAGNLVIEAEDEDEGIGAAAVSLGVGGNGLLYDDLTGIKAGGKSVITGTIQADGYLNNFGAMEISGTLVVGETGEFGSFDEDIVSFIPDYEDASVAVSGTVEIYGFSYAVYQNKGTIVFDSEVEYGTGINTVNMLADGAVLSVVNYAFDDTYSTLTVTDEGTELSSTVKVGSDKANVIGLGLTEISDDTVATVSGLKIVQSIAKIGSADSSILSVSGEVSISADAKEDMEVEKPEAKAALALNGTTRIAVSDDLVVKAGIAVTNSGNLYVSGSADLSAVTFTNSKKVDVVESGILKTATQVAGTINATEYKTTVSSKDVYNYVTIGTALTTVNQDNNTIKALTVLGDQTLAAGNTLPADVTLEIKGKLSIGTENGADVQLTLADGSALKGTGKVIVNGTLYAENYSNVASQIRGGIASDVLTQEMDGKKIVKDGWAKWTNIYTALTEAAEGETVKVTRGITDDDGYTDVTKDIVIPAGVTLKVEIGKAPLLLKNGVTMTVKGTLDTEADVYAETMFGTTAMKVTGDNAKLSSAIVVEGYILTVAEVAYGNSTPGTNVAMTDGAPIYGAYYTMDGKYVISSVAGAVAEIADIDSDIVVNGVVSADVSFVGTTACKVITVGKVVVKDMDNENVNTVLSGNIVLDGASLTAEGTYKGTVSVGEAVVTLEAAGFTAADVEDKLVLSGTVTGKTVEITAGTVTGKMTTEVKVKVASGATLAADGAYVKNMAVEGTLSIAKEKRFTATGTVSLTGAIVAEEDSVATIAVLDAGVTGTDYTGAAVTVTGKVAITGQIFASTSAVIDEQTTKDLKSTTYYVDTTAFLVIYDASGSYKIYSVTKKVPVENAYFDGEWNDKDQKTVADDAVIGSPSAVYANVVYEIYNVIIKADKGVDNIYLNGQAMSRGTVSDGDYTYEAFYTLGLKAGTYTVKASLANGYDGTATLYIDGNKQSSLSITASGNPADGETEVQIVGQLSGIEKSGYVDPVEPVKSDDGLKVTDYLLIVLVILVVILAVIVALRLMRS